MSTKQPATPLPWQVDAGGDGEIEIWAPPYRRTLALVGDGLRATSDDTTNAAYIAHACNAYPQLVAALRGMAHLAELVPGDETPVHRDARTLLAKLGE